MSASGNTEWFEFKITSEIKLSDIAVNNLIDAHGCGGQSTLFEYEMQDGLHTWDGKSTRYSD